MNHMPAGSLSDLMDRETLGVCSRIARTPDGRALLAWLKTDLAQVDLTDYDTAADLETLRFVQGRRHRIQGLIEALESASQTLLERIGETP